MLSTLRKLLGFGRAARAKLDLTKTTTENSRHWKDSDALSARAAYPQSQRKLARERSRLEAANNSWYAGMLRTAANHIIGTGPRLQVLTNNPAVNANIERAWRIWSQRIRLAEKLRIAVETYWRDGECFGMRATSSQTKIGLDFRLYEGDQVSQPYAHRIDASVEDGKRIDNLGNAVEYWIYDHHPGDVGIGFVNYLKGDWYRAADVWHLYRSDRPGQIRGIPRCSPAIDWLAHMRRFSKATLSAAELFALQPFFMKTTGSGVTSAQMPEDMMTVAYERGVMNFLPEGWEGWSPDPKYPNTTEEMFQRIGLMYFARCCNMPYPLACGTAMISNFSSVKMDIKNIWEPEVKNEQDTVTSVVLMPTFEWFLDECALMPGILDGAPPNDQIEYRFDWPPLPQADEIDVANAAVIRMKSGLTTPRQEAMSRGEDYDSKIRTGAMDAGISEDEYRQIQFTALLGASAAAANAAPGADSADDDTGADAMSSGAFTGTKRRDHTNNEKATDDVLQRYCDGAPESRTKHSLQRLGWSESAAISLMEEAKATATKATEQEVAA